MRVAVVLFVMLLLVELGSAAPTSAKKKGHKHNKKHSHQEGGLQVLNLQAEMGWKEETGLGKSEQGLSPSCALRCVLMCVAGRVEPVRADGAAPRKGLGKESMDMQYADEATKERLRLEIEKELTYPGEVRVTLVRETRVVEYAR